MITRSPTIHRLGDLEVELSAPWLARREHEHFWNPGLMRFPDGTVALHASLGDDRLTEDRAVAMWSRDGGATWSEPRGTVQSKSYLPLPSGEVVVLPFHLFAARGGARGPATLLSADGGVRVVRDGVTVAGLPRALARSHPDFVEDAATMDAQGQLQLYFNGIPIRGDGRWLATLYGIFGEARKYTLLVAESADGFAWRIRAVVADERCDLPGANGPCEAALCRLPGDGRLMCVYRVGDGVPFGQSFSADDGLTWTVPSAMAGPHSVEPSLLALRSGVVALSAGRPGLDLWLDPAGLGREWRRVDVLAHHNAQRPEEEIRASVQQSLGGTVAYAAISEIAPDTLLYCYDRVPDSFRVRQAWAPRADAGPREGFSIYAVRITVRRR